MRWRARSRWKLLPVCFFRRREIGCAHAHLTGYLFEREICVVLLDCLERRQDRYLMCLLKARRGLSLLAEPYELHHDELEDGGEALVQIGSAFEKVAAEELDERSEAPGALSLEEDVGVLPGRAGHRVCKKV